MQTNHAGATIQETHTGTLGRGISSISEWRRKVILKTIQRQGLPEHFSRQSQARARKTACSEVTPYGPLVQQVEIDNLSVPIQHPLAMLWRCSSLTSFQGLFHQICNGGPLTLLLYCDGISPQDGLSKHDKRKMVAIYWSLLEFDYLLSDETLWFSICVLRVELLGTITGGLSRLIRDLVRLAFWSTANNLRTGVELHDGLVIAVDKLLCVADGLALNEMLD